jgi:uncharacterized heparinase superfamily protein
MARNVNDLSPPPGLLYRAIGKPPEVIAFRAAQELRLALMRLLGRWPRLEERIAAWWTPERVERYFCDGGPQGHLIASDARHAIREATARGLIAPDPLLAAARRFRDRDFEIFGSRVPREGEWPWHTDWRWLHRWPPAYFQTYDFYEVRPQPYDVKFPWELSRLGFVLPLFQAAGLDGDGSWMDTAVGLIRDWDRENRLAHSIGWYSMEASMRAIVLVTALEMLLVLDRRRAADAALILRLISSHGEFVWRTVEYTDVRGNHYAANIVALLLCGLALENVYPGAARWLAYALERVSTEIELQLLPDGVDFEKSLAYHRLVTELFLIALVAMRRRGAPVAVAVEDRLRAACRYSAACLRPDGMVPNIGDNDGGRALWFDPADSRDHRPLIGTAAAAFSDGTLKAAGGRMPATLPWLLGRAGIEQWERLPAESSRGTKYFAAGGVITSRWEDNYLWFDAGEVGQAGLGGHGHNDLLSFELVLNGAAVVVDPGCPVYSGDLALRNLFRSTAYHNGLRVDGCEIATMSGAWRIGADAVPVDIVVDTCGTTTDIQAGHTGYRRLPDPVSHTRFVTFDGLNGALRCRDRLQCRSRHTVERYLHLDPEVMVTLEDTHARLAAKSGEWSLVWNPRTVVQVLEGLVSPGYGITRASSVIVMADTIDGDCTLEFTITPIHREGP